MFNKINLLKLTLMSHITETKGTSNDILRFIQVEIIGALNGSKSEWNDVF